MQTVAVQDIDAVRVITFNRPDALNAFNGQLMDDLTDAFLAAGTTETVKVVVLTGAGRAFSAGADLQEMGRATHRPRHGFPGLMTALIDFQKPFFVAVNGLGVGIGATICGLADFVLMADTARLRCPFSALGLTAEAASTLTFPALMGRQRASWFLLSAEWMDASACLAAGLAMEIVPSDQLLDRTLAQARVLAALPLASLIQTKSLILEPLRPQLRAVAERENAALAAMVGQPANREALNAFREKRAPDFAGL
ncbi:MAG: enoyl-CoA hydratase/isomerase family protein [Gammaproteobacteria bacterium]